MKKVKFITQGCSANHADSEVMQGLLEAEGYSVCDDADLVVFNTCTVKGPTDTFFKKTLDELEKSGKKVVIAGCIAQSEPKRAELEKHSLIGTYNISRIGEVVSAASQHRSLKIIERENKPRLNLPKRRRDNLVEIVPISHGCLSACTFCKTKHARGQLYSYPVDEIVRHVSAAVAEGVKEVWLTSQDCSAYGFDIQRTLPELLDAICSIDRDFKVRVGMGNPDHFLQILDDFVHVLKHPKIYKFAHIPVQAGSDKVLQDMKREYTVKEYEEIIARLRQAFPLINITTDIICGFPTESEEDFEATLALMKRAPTDNVNISRYWPRPGTPAAKLKPLPGSEVKRRTRLVTKVYNDMGRKLNSRWKHWTGAVCVMESGKGESWLGRNDYYKQVVLKQPSLHLGQSARVRISHTTSVDLRAEDALL